MARLRREAQVLAALNHPHIAAIERPIGKIETSIETILVSSEGDEPV